MANVNAVGDEYESFGGEYSGGGETVGRCEEMWGVIFGRAHCQSIQWMFSDLVMELVQRQGGNPKASAFARAFEVEAGEKAIESQEVGISWHSTDLTLLFSNLDLRNCRLSVIEELQIILWLSPHFVLLQERAAGPVRRVMGRRCFSPGNALNRHQTWTPVPLIVNVYLLFSCISFEPSSITMAAGVCPIEETWRDSRKSCQFSSGQLSTVKKSSTYAVHCNVQTPWSLWRASGGRVLNLAQLRNASRTRHDNFWANLAPSADYNGFPRYSQYDWDEPECILPVCSCRVWDQLQHTHMLRVAIWIFYRCSFFTVQLAARQLGARSVWRTSDCGICCLSLRMQVPRRASLQTPQSEHLTLTVWLQKLGFHGKLKRSSDGTG